MIIDCFSFAKMTLPLCSNTATVADAFERSSGDVWCVHMLIERLENQGYISWQPKALHVRASLWKNQMPKTHNKQP